ncbi:unnamed protein product [Darwinula stevensoni]|uniref:Glycosyltransferase 2-like domain-containing protein n=1 Tax=Darwinula stevensoni TaxID=69355 RepID=A0A7R8X9Q8_9CRUS|nr:unnamed protein product [Darwinula stevensoni]CAG0885832.1 unnamed protein product [Darwinula stevensoni]
MTVEVQKKFGSYFDDWSESCSRLQHLLHCVIIVAMVGVVEFVAFSTETTWDDVEPHRFSWTIFAYFLRFLSLLNLPMCVMSLLGLTMYDAFPGPVRLRADPDSLPFVVVRIVTRGDFPDLVCQNSLTNLRVCKETGLRHYSIEVVTKKSVQLPKMVHLREIVVPDSYEPSSGSMYKARQLQYCLEDGINELGDEDWILHLDEDSVLTPDAVKGMMNFIHDGEAHFGTGLVVTTRGPVANWMTTLADLMKTGDDMGRTRFLLKTCRKSWFGWKGSFFLANAKAERIVSFDNGPAGSIAEDSYFAMKGIQEGFRFGFIEGEVLEQSPCTLGDFLRQRKRWIQGYSLIVSCPKVITAHTSSCIAYHTRDNHDLLEIRE